MSDNEFAAIQFAQVTLELNVLRALKDRDLEAAAEGCHQMLLMMRRLRDADRTSELLFRSVLQPNFINHLQEVVDAASRLEKKGFNHENAVPDQQRLGASDRV